MFKKISLSLAWIFGLLFFPTIGLMMFGWAGFLAGIILDYLCFSDSVKH